MQTQTERLRRLAAAARASRELADADREARDAAIEEAELAQLSVREIAAAAGMSSARVHRIVFERAAARQERLRRAAGVTGPPQGPA